MTSPREAQQFRALVVRPALRYLGLWSEAAENLVVGTAVFETGLDALVQVGGGPALGYFQMEPASHRDLRDRLRRKRPMIAELLDRMLAPWPDPDAQLVTTLRYAAGVCRCKYYLDPAPLPEAFDIDGLGAYYKRAWNGPGKGTAAGWAERYRALRA